MKIGLWLVKNRTNRHKFAHDSCVGSSPSQGRSQPSLPAGWNLFCHQQIHQNMIMLPFHMVMFRPHWDFCLVASLLSTSHIILVKKGYTDGFFMRYTLVSSECTFPRLLAGSWLAISSQIPLIDKLYLILIGGCIGYIRHFGRGWLNRKQDQTWGQLVSIFIGWN